MTQMTLVDEGWTDTVRDLRAAKNGYLDAFAGANFSAMVSLMDAWQSQIWVDTGALADSAFVTKPDRRKNNQESIAGFVAPYANIVEVVHPSRPYILRSTYVENETQLLNHIATETERLQANGLGLDSVHSPYPQQGRFQPREKGTTSRKWGAY